MSSRLRTFRDFWPYYLSQHSRAATRLLHATGTVLGLIVAVVGLALGNLWLVPAGFGVGYGFAWFSHFAIERNRPATFRYPLWSFLGDWRMVGLMVTLRGSAVTPPTTDR